MTSNRVRIERGVIDAWSTAGTPESAVGPGICNGNDDRIPDSDARVGRLLQGLPIDVQGVAPYQLTTCTASIIDQCAGDLNKVHVSAAHCFKEDDFEEVMLGHDWNRDLKRPYILQFGVPLSLNNCAIQHPGPSRQFPVDGTTVLSNYSAGVFQGADDWVVFRCHLNDATPAQTTFQAAGQVAFTLPRRQSPTSRASPVLATSA
jgi:hypothetical protein